MNYQYQGHRFPRGRVRHPRGNYPHRGRGGNNLRGHWHNGGPNNQYRPRFSPPSLNWSGSPSFQNNHYTPPQPYPAGGAHIPRPPLLQTPTFQERVFRSPPPLPPSRASPLPGSEEYIQRNIKETSERIKKQLNLENEEADEDEETPNVEICFNSTFKPDAIFSETPSEVDVDLDQADHPVRVPKITNRRESKNEVKYDVEEIRNKIISHITNLSAGKKVNLINIGSESYDEAIHQIQKSERLAIIRALRDTCSDQPTEASSILNSIIPDMDIKIEDLPADKREELSSSLKIYSDEMFGAYESTVDPDLMFKQAQEMLSGLPDDVDSVLGDVNVPQDDNTLCNMELSPLNTDLLAKDPINEMDELIEPLEDPAAETLKIREMLNEPVISSDMSFRKKSPVKDEPVEEVVPASADHLERLRALEESYKQFEAAIFPSLGSCNTGDTSPVNPERFLNDSGRFKGSSSNSENVASEQSSNHIPEEDLLPVDFNFSNSYLKVKQSIKQNYKNITGGFKDNAKNIEKPQNKRVEESIPTEKNMYSSPSRNKIASKTETKTSTTVESLDERIARELQSNATTKENLKKDQRRKRPRKPSRHEIIANSSNESPEIASRGETTPSHDFLQPKTSQKVTETSESRKKKVWRSPGEKKFMSEQTVKVSFYEHSDTELDFSGSDIEDEKAVGAKVKTSEETTSKDSNVTEKGNSHARGRDNEDVTLEGRSKEKDDGKKEKSDEEKGSSNVFDKRDKGKSSKSEDGAKESRVERRAKDEGRGKSEEERRKSRLVEKRDKERQGRGEEKGQGDERKERTLVERGDREKESKKEKNEDKEIKQNLSVGKRDKECKVEKNEETRKETSTVEKRSKDKEIKKEKREIENNVFEKKSKEKESKRSKKEEEQRTNNSIIETSSKEPEREKNEEQAGEKRMKEAEKCESGKASNSEVLENQANEQLNATTENKKQQQLHVERQEKEKEESCGTTSETVENETREGNENKTAETNAPTEKMEAEITDLKVKNSAVECEKSDSAEEKRETAEQTSVEKTDSVDENAKTASCVSTAEFTIPTCEKTAIKTSKSRRSGIHCRDNLGPAEGDANLFLQKEANAELSSINKKKQVETVPEQTSSDLIGKNADTEVDSNLDSKFESPLQVKEPKAKKGRSKKMRSSTVVETTSEETAPELGSTTVTSVQQCEKESDLDCNNPKRRSSSRIRKPTIIFETAERNIKTEKSRETTPACESNSENVLSEGDNTNAGGKGLSGKRKSKEPPVKDSSSGSPPDHVVTDNAQECADVAENNNTMIAEQAVSDKTGSSPKSSEMNTAEEEVGHLTRSRSKRAPKPETEAPHIVNADEDANTASSSGVEIPREKKRAISRKSKRRAKLEWRRKKRAAKGDGITIKAEEAEGTHEEVTVAEVILVKEEEYIAMENSEENFASKGNNSPTKGLLRVKSLSQLLPQPDDATQISDASTNVNEFIADPPTQNRMQSPSQSGNESDQQTGTVQEPSTVERTNESQKQHLRKRKLPESESAVPAKKLKVTTRHTCSQTDVAPENETSNAASQTDIACSSCEAYKMDLQKRKQWVDELRKIDETIQNLLLAKAELYDKLLAGNPDPARKQISRRVATKRIRVVAKHNSARAGRISVIDNDDARPKNQAPHVQENVANSVSKKISRRKVKMDAKLYQPCFVHLFRYTQKHIDRMKRDAEYLNREESRRYGQIENEKGGVSSFKIVSVTSLASDESATTESNPIEATPQLDIGDTQLRLILTQLVEVVLVLKMVDSDLLAATDCGKIHFFDLQARMLAHTICASSMAITSLCISSNGRNEKLLYVGSLDATLKFYDYPTKKMERYVLLDERVQCMEVMWGCAFMGSDKGHLTRYSCERGKREFHERISESNVLVIKATTEGGRRVLLVALKQSPVCVRDAMSGLLMRNMEAPFSPSVYTLLLEKNLVYCGTSKHDIVVHDFHDGQLVCKHKLPSPAGVVVLHVLGNLLFAGCYNGNVYVFNTATSAYLGCMKGPGGLLLSMTVVNDAMIVVGTKQKLTTALPIPEEFLREK